MQRLLTPTELPVEVVESPGRDLAARNELVERRRALPFAFDRELPCRFTVVTDAGRPVYVVPVVCHMAVDSRALHLLHGAFLRALRHGDNPACDPPWQPWDQAEVEASEQVRALGARACAQWVREIRRAGAPLWGAPRTTAEEPRFVNARLTSGRVPQLVAAAAVTQKASETSILIAACTAAIVARTGHRGARAMEVVSSNRQVRKASRYVGPLAQTGILAVDCAGTTRLTALVREVAERSPRTFLSSYWSPADLTASLHSAGLPEQHHHATSFMVNGVRANHMNATAADVVPHSRPTAPSTLEWLPSWRYQPSHCSIMFGGDQECATVSMRMDSRHLDREATAATLSFRDRPRTAPGDRGNGLHSRPAEMIDERPVTD